MHALRGEMNQHHCEETMHWFWNVLLTNPFHTPTCSFRYGTEAPAQSKPPSEKKLENQDKRPGKPEKRPFQIRDQYRDRDSEYICQENEPDGILDQQLLEELQKKKTDLRYIEMQVMESRV